MLICGLSRYTRNSAFPDTAPENKFPIRYQVRVYVDLWTQPIHSQFSLKFPDTARVIFRARYYRVSTVIKCAAKNFVCVTFKYLKAIAGLGIPEARCFVTACCQNSDALWVKCYFRNF